MGLMIISCNSNDKNQKEMNSMKFFLKVKKVQMIYSQEMPTILD